MSKTYISAELRQKITTIARHRCSYCQTQASLIGMSLEIDHIIPESQGGTSDEPNLCLACPNCNQHKWAKVSAIDPQSQEEVPLFHPRQQDWGEHFIWQQNGLYVQGITPIGRATVDALGVNNKHVVRSRAIWIQWGVHPPHDEIVQK